MDIHCGYGFGVCLHNNNNVELINLTDLLICSQEPRIENAENLEGFEVWFSVQKSV